MKVSAIVSTYNSQKYIAGCLEDLLSQSIAGEIEIIVVNSGSKQNESEIVRGYQRRFSNILLIETKRETIYSSWNRGIKVASGEYISNANTDDRHHSNFFELLTQELDKDKTKVLCYADFEMFVERKEKREVTGINVRGEYSRERLLKTCFIGPQPVWRKAVHTEFGYFDERFIVAGDYEFWLRISQKYDFCYLNKVLGQYLFRKDSLERKDGRKLCLEETATIQKKYR